MIPFPPKCHRLFDRSTHALPDSRAPGLLAEAATPCEPNVDIPALLFINVQFPADTSYFQRSPSLSEPTLESIRPPNSQKFPFASVQCIDLDRPPGLLVGAGTPVTP